MGWAKPEEIAAKKEEDIGWSPPSKQLALLTVDLFGQLLLGSSQETAQADAALLDLRAAYPPPGEMVDMGRYRLHILSQGCCSPTVVFEAGAGSSSLVWTRVAPEAAGFARVVTYGRAGLG